MPNERYRGSAWNARFLYAPKIALEIDQRPDFVALRSLASVAMGVKTGCDDFFFVSKEEGTARSPSYVHVKGFRNWTGDLAKSDLLGAVRNPRDLTRGGQRLFQVPRRTPYYYLYPTGRLTKADLESYVLVGEEAGVNDRPSVRQNAGGNEWFVQARGIVQPDWVLPYNSAYDYGAFENESRAVLNGRLVGATAWPEIDRELLGAALNSTFVIVSRLIEGGPTGTEGAFDVGPPAARLMKVPDVRAMQGSGVERIRVAMHDLRQANEMPSAPDRNGQASEIRRRLDDAVLHALGVSAGDRAVLLDRLYAAYGRWRASVEDVEMRMRTNRNAIARLGLSRAESPVQRATRTVWDELSSDFPVIPNDLLNENDSFNTVDIAPSYSQQAIGQDALFGEGLIPDGRGGVIDLRSIDRVRYAVLLREIGFGKTLDVVVGDHRAADVVRLAREEISRFGREAAVRAAQYVGSDYVGAVVDGALRLWYDRCRAEYRRWREAYQEAAAANPTDRIF
jgi:hypothetical protein